MIGCIFADLNLVAGMLPFKILNRLGRQPFTEMSNLGVWNLTSQPPAFSKSIHKSSYYHTEPVTIYPKIVQSPILLRKSQTTVLQINKDCKNRTGLSSYLNRPTIAYNGVRFLSTENLFRLNETNAGRVQPVLDIENILNCQTLYQESIKKRQLNRRDVAFINGIYAEALELKKRKEKVQQERDENTAKCQELVRSDKDKQSKVQEMKHLKETGRVLREQLRDAEIKFNAVNDELVDYILSLPNTLDPKTPESEAVLLDETKIPSNVIPWEFPEYTAVESSVGPGLLSEFPIGQSAWLDVQLREKAQSHLLKGGFEETGNAEYVKRVILQAAGIDHTQFLRIREPNVKKGLDHATYLAGGASFPSFLALFAQSIIDTPDVLPLRYFVIGRSYEMQKERPGMYQSHVVQAFVACRNEEEMEKEFEKLKGLMESFYSTKVGFSFQTQLVPASRLKLYEKKKLAFVMDKTEKSPSKMVGTLSTVGDYVSKRLLCCYFDGKKQTQFLYLISAQFFDITHFLRSSNPRVVTHSDSNVIAAVAELHKQNNALLEQEQPSK